jgi:hypothetical protein
MALMLYTKPVRLNVRTLILVYTMAWITVIGSKGGEHARSVDEERVIKGLQRMLRIKVTLGEDDMYSPYQVNTCCTSSASMRARIGINNDIADRSWISLPEDTGHSVQQPPYPQATAGELNG